MWPNCSNIVTNPSLCRTLKVPSKLQHTLQRRFRENSECSSLSTASNLSRVSCIRKQMRFSTPSFRVDHRGVPRTRGSSGSTLTGGCRQLLGRRRHGQGEAPQSGALVLAGSNVIRSGHRGNDQQPPASAAGASHPRRALGNDPLPAISASPSDRCNAGQRSEPRDQAVGLTIDVLRRYQQRLEHFPLNVGQTAYPA